MFVFNKLRQRQNCRCFADDIFKCIFLNETIWTSLKMPLKFVPNVRINNIPALIQIMVWCRLGDKPLSKPVMVNLLTHICVTRPQWVTTLKKWPTFNIRKLKCYLLRENRIWLKLNWSFLTPNLQISQHCFGQWLDDVRVISQWWHSSLPRIGMDKMADILRLIFSNNKYIFLVVNDCILIPYSFRSNCQEVSIG